MHRKIRPYYLKYINAFFHVQYWYQCDISVLEEIHSQGIKGLKNPNIVHASKISLTDN